MCCCLTNIRDAMKLKKGAVKAPFLVETGMEKAMGLLKNLFSRSEKKKPTQCSVVLVAAGAARRMEGVDKIFHLLGGTPVLIHSLRYFECSDLVAEIIVVTRREVIVEVAQLCKDYGMTKVTKVLPGGESRTESVQLGLEEVSHEADLVAIHDGARPFVTQEVLEEAILKAAETGAAAPGIPVKDTIKVVRSGIVKNTLERDALYAIQTPQVFEVGLIKGALHKARQENVVLTDDCAAVERIGFTVCVTQGSEENIKLTTPEDLVLGEAIQAGRAVY